MSDGEMNDTAFFFRRCAQLALVLFFVALFIPLKISAYQVLFFLSGDNNPYQHFFLYLSDIFFLVSFLCVGVSLFLRPSQMKAMTFGSVYLLAFWLALLVLAEVSLIVSADRTLSFLLALRLAQGFLLYLALLQELISLRVFLFIMVFGLLGQSILGIFQYVHGGSLGLSFLGESPLGTAIPGVSTLMVDGQKILRAYGTFPHPNVFAAYLIFGLFGLKCLSLRNPYVYGAIGFFMLIALFVTFSRTALFSGLAGVGVYYVLMKRRLSSNIIITAAVALFVILASLNIGNFFLERLKFQDTQALQFRAENVTDGARLLAAHPFGVGLGQSSVALQTVVPQKLSPWEYQPAHNLFLITSNELGLFGLALYLFLFAFILVQLYRRREYAPHVFALWVSVTILSFSDHYFFSLYHGWILFVILLVVAAQALRDTISDV